MSLKLPVFLVVAQFQPGQSRVRIDLERIAGKSQSEVAAALGNPTGRVSFQPSGNSCTCERILFFGGKVSILFIDGKADWIYLDRDIDVEGLLKVKAIAFHQFEYYTLIKIKTTDEAGCCPAGP